MSKEFKQKLTAYGLVIPAFLVVMMTVAYPILSAVIQSFQDEKTGEFTLDNYLYFFTEPMQIRNILYTLFVVLMTVVIAIVVAYLLALYLRFVKSKVARTIGTLYLLPRFVPAMCAVYAMITIIRDSGLVNRIGTLFGLNIKLGLMYHANGISTINIYQGLVTRRLIEVLKKEGIGVSAWTVNEPSELEWFLQSGVTNITTRNLQKALALR